MPFPDLLRGVVPPLCTPMTASGEVDTRSLKALVERLVSAGMHALFVLGSTGEAAYLSDAQRRTALEAVVEAADHRVPVLAGVIDTTTARVLDHAHVAAAAGDIRRSFRERVRPAFLSAFPLRARACRRAGGAR